MQKKQGISLIVLVITIIVMVILAGAIILTLNNSGIIGKASEAVEETNLTTVKEVASLAWAEAYADGVRTVEDTNGIKGFKSRVEEALEKNNIDLDKYKLIVTENGVAVSLKGEIKAKWEQEGTIVTNGETTLEVGDYINYDETAGGTISVKVDTDWQVLGAENGELLILSTGFVDGGNGEVSSGTSLIGTNGWLNGVTILNDICAPYAKGKGAINARSIKEEDIHRITGYNPMTAENGNPAGYGKMYEYGNEVTFTWDSIIGSNGQTKKHSVSEFTYYNGKEFVTVTKENNPDWTTTIQNNYYNVQITDTFDKETYPKACEMLFGKYLDMSGMGDYYYNMYYWLASPAVSIASPSNNKVLQYDYRAVIGGRIEPDGPGGWGMDYSYTFDDGTTMNGGETWSVRAVVHLSSELELTGSSDEGWIIE